MDGLNDRFDIADKKTSEFHDIEVKKYPKWNIEREKGIIII